MSRGHVHNMDPAPAVLIARMHSKHELCQGSSSANHPSIIFIATLQGTAMIRITVQVLDWANLNL